ncbi:hypothetical protein KR51_00016790 [Rubidibacter lacunae KORDI 51-2]|uniref:Uncharacterized protein n=1 Tax=Rubidibacter lacunae KORDI 51-2 TaxID=582515 RepID=U5DM81_9CHRO|nr:hypothetical protein [Rubidibacter lacunae]ERN41689.1 hypothetical protein KR51_00016790 [Rubidibacter lacunae KORDI 51-2]
MGYHVTVNISNHTKEDVNYAESMHLYQGDIEHGPVRTIPAGSMNKRAFTGYASGSHEASGYVNYYFPGSSGCVMKINYGTETAVTGQTDGYETYTACVYVYCQTPNKYGFSAESAGYFVVMENAILISKKKGGYDMYTATLHIYPVGSQYLTPKEPKLANPIYYLLNKTNKWVHLRNYVNLHPYELTNGTTSIGPGDQRIILDGCPGTQFVSPYPALTYSIDEDRTFQFIPSRNTEGSTWVPPTISWPQNQGNYDISIQPIYSCADTYTLTLTEKN